ncbi:hypothetical protein Tco_1196090 [Tanacetum coccineum]
MHNDLMYSMLHEMIRKKFNLETNDRLNLSVKLPSFDSRMDITDDDEGKTGHAGHGVDVVGSKECIGDNPNLLFISDRHHAIALEVNNEFLLAFHVSYIPDEFTTNMNALQVVQPDAYQRLLSAGLPKGWS